MKMSVIIKVKRYYNKYNMLLDYLEKEPIQENTEYYLNCITEKVERIGLCLEAIGNDINSVIPNDNLRITKTNYEDNFDKTKVYYQTYSNPFTSNLLNPNNDTLVKISVINTDVDYFNFVNDYLKWFPSWIFGS